MDDPRIRLVVHPLRRRHRGEPLTPYLGYAQAAEIAKAALAGDTDVRELALGSGAMGAEQLDELLRPERLTQVGPRTQS